MKKLLVYVLMVIVLFGLAACAEPATTQEPSLSAGLEGSTWILESYGEEGDLQAVLEGTEITATFDSKDGQVRGSGGANTYFGDYEARKNQLSISRLTWTEMFRLDPEGVMEQEHWYLSALQETETYVIEDGELRISCSGGQVLIFRVK